MKVKYFIPEDGDDAQHPNVFVMAENGNGITLSQIKTRFPLPGEYHFRLFKEIDRMRVWMDIMDDSAVLPVENGTILLKVSRIIGQPTPATAFAPNVGSNTGYKATTPSVINPVPAPGRREDTDKLLNFADDEPFVNPVQANVASPMVSTAATFDDDLLGMSSTSSSQTRDPPAKTVSNPDLFGLDTLQPMSSSTMASAGGQSFNNISSSFNPMTNMGNAPPRSMGMPPQQMPPRMGGPGYDPFGSINSLGAPVAGRGGQQQMYGSSNQYGQRPQQRR